MMGTLKVLQRRAASRQQTLLAWVHFGGGCLVGRTPSKWEAAIEAQSMWSHQEGFDDLVSLQDEAVSQACWD